MCCTVLHRILIRESLVCILVTKRQAKKSAKKTTSFRIDPQTLEKLYEAAGQDAVSVNTLVNKVLFDYVDWDRIALKAGWVLFKQEILKLFIENLSEKEITKFAIQSAKAVMKDTLLAITGKIDLNSWLFVTKHRSEKSNFVYKEFRRDKRIEIVITHGMGQKWSLFHKTYYLHMLKQIGIHATADHTAKTLVINIYNT
jgi:hypothetical protein